MRSLVIVGKSGVVELSPTTRYGIFELDVAPIIDTTVAGALSEVPAPPAEATLKLIFEYPAPVEVPDERISAPPFLSVALEVAPLAWTVRLLPAVFPVVLRSIQNV